MQGVERLHCWDKMSIPMLTAVGVAGYYSSRGWEEDKRVGGCRWRGRGVLRGLGRMPRCAVVVLVVVVVYGWVDG